MTAVTAPATSPCPCGSSNTYHTCCGKYHSGTAHAETAEKLMRSRYCAFVLRDGAYLTTTLAEEKRNEFNTESISSDPTEWTGLEIVECVAGGVLDQTGKVEFIARFIENGETHQLHERSNFERRNGKWVYVDGVFPGSKHSQSSTQNDSKEHIAAVKVGRNDPCPCGSGKKFKKCCG